MVATDTHTTIEELLEVVFSERSVSRLYNEGQLPLDSGDGSEKSRRFV
jgi:hypothetical protein